MACVVIDYSIAILISDSNSVPVSVSDELFMLDLAKCQRLSFPLKCRDTSDVPGMRL